MTTVSIAIKAVTIKPRAAVLVYSKGLVRNYDRYNVVQKKGAVIMMTRINSLMIS